VRRPTLLALGFLIAASVDSAGQAVRSRSADYLFTATVDDVRSLWVNPAGLGIVPETSILAELVFAMPEGSDTRVSQWTVGFNARGISVGFQRDRLLSDSANQALRLGFSRPFRGGAIGVAMTSHGSGISDQGWDGGVRLSILRPVAMALVVRNIGRPRVRAQITPISGVVGVAWNGIGGLVQLSTEALITERIATHGYDTSYRTGIQLSTPIPLPIRGFAVATTDGSLSVARWTFGLAVGGLRRAGIVATLPNETESDVDLLSVHGLATNRGSLLLRP
jgi:hypothetical protein